MACGNLFYCYYNGGHGCFYNDACGVNAPLSAVAGRVFVCVKRDNSFCVNGKRADGIVQLACNGDDTILAGASGGWPDWPASDRFGRPVWNIHTQERQGRLHGEREWWVHGREGGERIWGFACLTLVRSKCCCFKQND